MNEYWENEYMCAIDMIKSMKKETSVSPSEETLKKMYKLFFSLKFSDMLKLYELFREIAIMCLIENGDGIISDSVKHFKNKNAARDSCWTKSGVLGQTVEIQAKMERIMVGGKVGEDPLYDAWSDLFNYSIFGMICVTNKIYMPTYFGSKFKWEK